MDTTIPSDITPSDTPPTFWTTLEEVSTNELLSVEFLNEKLEIVDIESKVRFSPLEYVYFRKTMKLPPQRIASMAKKVGVTAEFANCVTRAALNTLTSKKDKACRTQLIMFLVHPDKQEATLKAHCS